MRRIIALLLCAALLAALGTAALADTLLDSGVQGNVKWQIVGRPDPRDPYCTFRVLVISGSGPMLDYDWRGEYCAGSVHPAWFKEHGSENGGRFQGIEIGSGITHIGANAFSPLGSEINDIAEVVIPGTVVSIGESAFSSQAYLYRAVVPDSVRSIGANAFHKSTQIVCSSGSAAYRYAQENGNPVELTDLTVTLSRDSLTLKEGGTATLTAIVSASGMTPTFHSRDTAVAVVDSATGVITARSAGSTEIEVYAGGRKLASCAVTVTALATPSPTAAPTPEPAAVEPDPTVAPTAAARQKNQITAGNVVLAASATKKQSVALKAQQLGDGKLTYSSDNKSVTVDRKGKVTVARKFVGKAVITVKAAKTKSYAAASKKVTVTVNPAGAKLSSATSPKRGNAKIKWKKDATGAGYQIQYATSKAFSGAKVVQVDKNSTLSKTVKKLKAGKSYYVRIRSFRKVGAETFYSGWSNVKKVKIKK